VKFFKKIGDSIFSLDLRSLAFFRIGLGFLLLCDLFNRSLSLTSHYTDAGVLPRDVLLSKFLKEWHIIIHNMSGETSVIAVLFIIHAFFAFLMMVGYRTKLSTFISWLLLISLQSRNPVVLQGGDTLFRMMIFWGVFLPLGARYSVDSLKLKPKFESNKFSSIASMCLILQVCYMYIFTAILKYHPIWFEDGTAVYYALNLDQFVTPIGLWIKGHFELTRFFTFGTIYLELIGPVLLFIPFYHTFLRSAVAILFIILHTGLFLSLELGLFSYICIVAWIGLFPTGFIDYLALKKTVKRYKNKFKKKLTPCLNKFPKPKEITFPCWVKVLACQVFPIVVLAFVTMWNIRSLNFDKYEKYFPKKLNWFAFIIRADQYWNMFAPYPLTEDGWYIIEGTLRDDTVVDIFNEGKPIIYEKPERVSKTYRSQRWRKYMMNIWKKKKKKHRLHYAKFVCRTWNAKFGKSPKALMTFKIHFMKEKMNADLSISPAKKVTIWNHSCFK